VKLLSQCKNYFIHFFTKQQEVITHKHILSQTHSMMHLNMPMH